MGWVLVLKNKIKSFLWLNRFQAFLFSDELPYLKSSAFLGCKAYF